MLIFHSHCQMGNQMFIYACAEALSAKKAVPACLSDTDGLVYFSKPNRNRWHHFIKYQYFRLYNKLKPNQYTFHHLQDNRIDYSEMMRKNPEKNTWYYGYFQGLSYFYGMDEEVRKWFGIRKKYQDRYTEVLENLSTKKRLVTVHLRRKDYKTFGPDFLKGPDLSLPFEYYHKILRGMDLKDCQLVFISDEMEEVKKEFAYINDAYFSSHEPIIDLQFLIHADVCIIANSTFGWWGAFLNEKKNKTIYVPAYFLGFKVQKEFPVNIIPTDWVRVAV